MRIIGNLLWWLFGGLEAAIGYFTGSLALACTIIGIPFALQTIKLGLLCLWPFGSTVRETDTHPAEYNLADLRRIVGLPPASALRFSLMYHDYRHSLGEPAFQDGWPFACALRQGCGVGVVE